ncbi:MAG: hypothetical protein A3B68_09630 [Candidatus Melainabacteria bacterium RIFCSPHIGHO2_02_FULL_34_12]|nr:MAG: hypothetical protein A3B68_09630 [Candidatus Melainabacteria bacterium RIFCSPHIGHO2_02_FULL_34_12]
MDKSEATSLKPKTKLLIIPNRTKPTVNPELTKTPMNSSQDSVQMQSPSMPEAAPFKKAKPKFLIAPERNKSSFNSNNSNPMKPSVNPPPIPPPPNNSDPAKTMEPPVAPPPKEEKTEIVENKGEKNTFDKESFVTVKSGENYYRVSGRGEIKIRRLEEESETFKYFYPDDAVVIPEGVIKISAKYRSEYTSKNIQKIYQNRKLAEETLVAEISSFKSSGRFMEGSAATIARITQYIEMTWKNEEKLLSEITKEENAGKYTDDFRQECKTKQESLREDKDLNWTNNPVYKSQELAEWESKAKRATELIKDLVGGDFTSEEKKSELIKLSQYALLPIYNEMVIARQNNDDESENKLGRILNEIFTQNNEKVQQRQEELVFTSTGDLADKIHFRRYDTQLFGKMVNGIWIRNIGEDPSDEIKALIKEMAELKETKNEKEAEMIRLTAMYKELKGVTKFPGRFDYIDLISRILEEEDANSPYDEPADMRGHEYLGKDFLTLDSVLKKLLEIKDPKERLEKFTLIWRSIAFSKFSSVRNELASAVYDEMLMSMLFNKDLSSGTKSQIQEMFARKNPRLELVKNVMEMMNGNPELKKEDCIYVISLIWNNTNSEPSLNEGARKVYSEIVSKSINLFLDNKNIRVARLPIFKKILRFTDRYNELNIINGNLNLVHLYARSEVFPGFCLLEPDSFIADKLKIFEEVKSILADKNSSESSKEAAIRLLSHFNQTPEVLPTLISCLGDKTQPEKVRIACAQVLYGKKYFVFATPENLTPIRNAYKSIMEDTSRSIVSLQSAAEDYLTVFNDMNGISVKKLNVQEETPELRDFTYSTGAKLYKTEKNNKSYLVYIKPKTFGGEERKIQINGKWEDIPESVNNALDTFIKLEKSIPEHELEVELHKALVLRNKGNHDAFALALKDLIKKNPMNMRLSILLAQHYAITSEHIKSASSEALLTLELGVNNLKTNPELTTLEGEKQFQIMAEAWIRYAEKYGSVEERKKALLAGINLSIGLVRTDRASRINRNMFDQNVLRYAELLNNENGSYNESLKYLKSLELLYPIEKSFLLSYWMNIILINEKLGQTDEARKICSQILGQIKIKESDKYYYGDYDSLKRNIESYLGYLDAKSNVGKWSEPSKSNGTQYAIVKEDSDKNAVKLYIKSKDEKTGVIIYYDRYCKTFEKVILNNSNFEELSGENSYRFQASYENLPKELK